MAQSPDSVEVVDFKMKQLCRFKIPGESYDISKTTMLLASSNIFGLVFVGTSDGIIVIKVSDVVRLDQATPSKKTEITDYPTKKIVLSSRPYFLALSCDSLTLLVCMQRSGCPVGLFYDVRGYAREAGDWLPFQEVRLSTTEGVLVDDCAWNPTMPELVAISLSDGSLITVELKDSQFTVNSLPSSTGIQVISWSPKGKQLAAARPGCLTQYKPDLKEAKSILITGNELNMGKPQACGLQWLSTSQFLVSYFDQDDSSARPHLFIINSYKSGPAKIIDYDDVCFGNMSVERPFRYITVNLVPWNVILASSATAMEIVVLGQSSTEDAEHPQWTQWTLEDEFRAELPLSAENDETRPLGMAIDTTSQLPIPWGDNQQLPPMPVLFVLNSSGLLCPFHVINLQREATPLNQAPQEITTANERKGLTNLGTKVLAEKKPLAASTPLGPPSRSSFFKPAAESSAPSASITSLTKPPETQASKGFFAPPASEPTRPLIKENQTLINQPLTKPPAQLAQTSKPTTFGAPSTADSITSVAKPTRMPSNKSEPEESGIGAARAVLNEEVTKFMQEMKEFKARSSFIKVEVASEQDKQRLMKLTGEMEAFGEELVETTKNQDEEVRSLCTELVDLAALLEDARVRHARRKNPRYNHLLKMRPLDPANRRKMDAIESLHIHIEQQIEEASRILDSISSGKPKDQQRKLEIPLTQVIYEAMKNNAKVISQLKSRVERVKAQSKEQQLKLAGAALEVLRSKEPEETKKWGTDLASLADSLLSTRIKQENDSLSTSSIQPVVLQVSPEKQAMLRNVLAQRPVARIRAARPESASESRLLSNLSAIMQQDEKKDTSGFSLDSSRTGSLPGPSTVSPMSATSQKTLAGFMNNRSNGQPGSLATSVSTGKLQLSADVEDITPPSTPVNLELKAKGLSGQPMISSLSLAPSGPAPTHLGAVSAPVIKRETSTASPKGFSFGTIATAPVSSSPSSISTGVSQTQPTSSAAATKLPIASSFSALSQGFGLGSSSAQASSSKLPGNAPASFLVSKEMNPASKASAVPNSSSSAFASPFSLSSFSTPPTTQKTLPQMQFDSMSNRSNTDSSAAAPKPPTEVKLQPPTENAALSTSGNTDQKPRGAPTATSSLSFTSSAFALSSQNVATDLKKETSSSLALEVSLETSAKPTVADSLVSLEGVASPAQPVPPQPTLPKSLSTPMFAMQSHGLSFTSTQGSSATTPSEPVQARSTTTNSTPTVPLNAGTASFTTSATTQSSTPSLFGTGSLTSKPSFTNLFGNASASPSSGITKTNSFANLSSAASTPIGTLGSSGSIASAAMAQQTTPLFGTSVSAPSITTATVTSTSTVVSTGPPAGLFKLTAATSSTPTVFGAPPSGLFKLSAATTDTSASGSSTPPTGLFKLAATSVDAAASGSSIPPAGPPAGLFKLPPGANDNPAVGATTPAAGLFKQPVTTAADASTNLSFGKPTATNPSSFSNTFGQGLLGQPTQGNAVTGSVFGQPFGKPATEAQSSGVGAASPFGAAPAFGQSSSVFGQSPAQGASVSATKPLFGSSAFAAPLNATPTTAASSSSSGFGSGFGSMGLGSTPNPANAQKNVFGGGAVFGNATATGQGMFGTTSSSAFGAQSPPATQTSAFGSPPSSPFGGGFGQSQPAFGGAPSFGSSPLFGSRPTFGGSATFGSPVSGGTPAKQEGGGGFGAFAAASNVPSFGGLASSGPSFGSLAQAGNAQPAFGGAAFSQNAQPAFGGSSSFSSWR